MSEEAVYRIYRNGKPYTTAEAHLKIKAVYVKEGSAKSVITNEVSYIARERYESKNPGKKYWNLTAVDRIGLEANIRLEFDVVKYVPESELEKLIDLSICEDLDRAKVLLSRLHDETMDPGTQLAIFESGLIE